MQPLQTFIRLACKPVLHIRNATCDLDLLPPWVTRRPRLPAHQTASPQGQSGRESLGTGYMVVGLAGQVVPQQRLAPGPQHGSQQWGHHSIISPQGNVLGPLLFNVLFDRISTAMRAACLGSPDAAPMLPP